MTAFLINSMSQAACVTIWVGAAQITTTMVLMLATCVRQTVPLALRPLCATLATTTCS